MNQNIFNFFFSLSSDTIIANSSVFISDILIYILFGIIFLFIILKTKPVTPHLFMIVGSAGGAWVASKILKSIFHIPRPFVTGNFMPLINETGFSFPSSHATVFAALSIVVFALNRKLGIFIIICTILIGISRMIVGVHYPLDILGGFALGVIIGLVFVRFMQSRYAVAFFGKSL